MNDSGQVPTPSAIDEERELLEKIYASVEKTRKLFLWTLIISVLTILLPLIGMMFAIPYLISSYATLLDYSALGL